MKVAIDLENHFKTGSKISQERAIAIVENSLLSMPGKLVIIGGINCADSRFEDFADKLPRSSRQFKNGILVNGSSFCFDFHCEGKEVLIIKGQEIYTNEGQIVAIGLPFEKSVPDGMSPEDSINAAKDLGAFVYANHPFSFEDLCYKNNDFLTPEKLRLFDGIQTWNGNFSKKQNALAYELWKKAREEYNLDIGSIVSSDGHSAYEVGSSYMFIPKPDLTNEKTLVDSLLDGIKKPRNSDEEVKRRNYLGHAEHLLGLGIYNTLGFGKYLNKGRREMR